MRIRFSLFARILLWFFLNLLVLGGAMFALFHWHFRFDPESQWLDGPGGKLEMVAREISDHVRERTREERNALMKRYSEDFQLEFTIFANTGEQLCGVPLALPPLVLERLQIGRAHV